MVRPDTKGEFGPLYEKYIIMLAYLRALNKGYSFMLQSNVVNCGAFDDVVFTYKDEENLFQHRIYLQAKHKYNKTKKIYFSNFFHDYNEVGKIINDKHFELFIYFKAFIKILDSDKVKFQRKYFIIYTNIDIKWDNTAKESKTENDKELKTRKDKGEPGDYLVFEKLDTSNDPLLEIFDSKNQTKKSNFYQFSRKVNEKERTLKLLKDKFEASDKSFKTQDQITNDIDLVGKLEKFFDSLVFAVNQSNADMLKKQIQEEIKLYYSCSEMQAYSIFCEVGENISMWKRNEKRPLTEEDNYFQDYFLKQKVDLSTSEYKKLFKTFDVPIGKIFDNKLEMRHFSDKSIWLVLSKTPWLSSYIMYQTFKYQTEKGSIDIGKSTELIPLLWNSPLSEHESLLSYFDAKDKCLLTILCLGNESNSSAIPGLSDLMKKTVNKNRSCSKKIIITAPENHELCEELNNLDHGKKVINFKFSDLPEELKNAFLAKKKNSF